MPKTKPSDKRPRKTRLKAEIADPVIAVLKDEELDELSGGLRTGATETSTSYNPASSFNTANYDGHSGDLLKKR